MDEQEETSNLRPPVAESSLVEEWTDEKHILYLKSMEATFVNQLNKSLGLFGRGAQKHDWSGTKSAKHKVKKICAYLQNSTLKFKVLRDGRWSKPDFIEGEAEARHDESKDLSANLWIQHYRFSERRTNRKFLITSGAQDHSATSSVNQDTACNFRFWRRDFEGSNAEVTDQNFNVEGLQEDKSDREQEHQSAIEFQATVVPSIVGEDDDMMLLKNMRNPAIRS